MRFDNSWYQAKTKFNNCSIIDFLKTLSHIEFSMSLIRKRLRTLHGQGAWKLRRHWTLHDKHNIRSRYWILDHFHFTHYCILIECSRPILSTPRKKSERWLGAVQTVSDLQTWPLPTSNELHTSRIQVQIVWNGLKYQPLSFNICVWHWNKKEALRDVWCLTTCVWH